MRNTMPAKPPAIGTAVTERITALAQQIRAHRKALRVSATAAAEAAGMSRVTLHRIEKGEPSVTMGAYLNAVAALGLEFHITAPNDKAGPVAEASRKGWIPARIRLADYPQLQALAWHVHGTEALTPSEALGIYERNWRHLDVQAMAPAEQDLVEALRLGLGAAKSDV